MSTSQAITVVKLDHAGQEVWRYEGHLLEQGARHILLEAAFTREGDMDLGFTVFRHGDRFVETFYSDRWYNVFEVHAADDDRLKGWYCNVTRPARLSENLIESEDLALDVWVHPDGDTLILDEDEFEAFPITEDDRQQARAALAEILRLVESGEPPFSAVQR